MALFSIKPTYIDSEGNWVSNDGSLFTSFEAPQISQASTPSAGVNLNPVDIGREVVKGTARTVASVGATIMNPILQAGGQQPITNLQTSGSRLGRTLFGGEPIKDLATRIAEGEQLAKQYGFGRGALPAAFVGVGALTAADITGGKGKVAKELGEKLAKELGELVLKRGQKEAGEITELIGRLTSKKIAPTDVQIAKDYLSGKSRNLKPLFEVSDVPPPDLPPVTRERGFVTSAREAYPEMRVAGQYIPRETDDLAIKAKNLIRSDIETATRIAMTETDDEAVAIGSELIKHYGDQANKISDPATRTALFDRGAEVANQMARHLTEQGRSIQAASILGRLTPEGQVRFAAREIQRYNEVIDKAKGGIFGLKKKLPELTGKQADEIVTEMKAINEMAEGTEKAIRFQKLQDKITNLIPSSLYQKMVSIWKAGLLTGMKTSGVNIFANASHALSETAKDLPAVAVDSIASLITKKRTMTLKATPPKGLEEGLQKGWQYLKTGYDERNLGAKLDYHKVNFGKGPIAKALQKYEETVFGVIGAEDQPFYYGAKARSIADQAQAQAINAGRRGDKKFIENLINNPTDEMSRYAVLDAETAVFQNKTVLGDIARKIQQAPGGEIIVPFGRTPSAVATQIINYSPIGVAKTIFENVGKGRFDQRLFSQGIGRGLTGTGVLALGAELYKNKLVTLDYPQDERERELWRLEGRVPNTVRIGDKWRSIQALGPAGNLLLIGGHFKRAYDKGGTPTGAMGEALAGSVKSFTEQTFLKGINQVVEAINDPARSAEGYLGSILSSTIPTIVSDIAKSTDPFERRTETVLDRMMLRLPQLRQKLEPQVDVFGQKDTRQGNFFETLADPSRPSNIQSSPIITELRRLQDSGFKVAPTKLGDKTGFKALTKDQNTELWIRAGEISKKKLESLLRNQAYFELNDEKKTKLINDIVDKSKLMARVEKVIQLTEGIQGDNLIKRLKELKAGGLMTQQVFDLYQDLR